MAQRPDHVKPPAHLSPSPPVPQPAIVPAPGVAEPDPDPRDPTRYGDWERNGVAVDF